MTSVKRRKGGFHYHPALLFGTEATFNLNSSLYDWNNEAPGAAGTAFTGGAAAFTAGAGLLLGAAVAAISMTAAKKRKKTEPTTV